MQVLIVASFALLLVINFTTAAPQQFGELNQQQNLNRQHIHTEPTSRLVQHQENRDDHGQYSLSYSISDGQTKTEQGQLKTNADNTDHVLVKQGSFSFVGDDGITYGLTYIADENGYQPTGAHLGSGGTTRTGTHLGSNVGQAQRF